MHTARGQWLARWPLLLWAARVRPNWSGDRHNRIPFPSRTECRGTWSSMHQRLVAIQHLPIDVMCSSLLSLVRRLPSCWSRSRETLSGGFAVIAVRTPTHQSAVECELANSRRTVRWMRAVDGGRPGALPAGLTSFRRLPFSAPAQRRREEELPGASRMPAYE